MNNSFRRFSICLFTIALLFVGLGLNAQDSLRMKTGAIYSVRIIEISETLIKYRTFSNPDGPLYTVSKTTIDRYKIEGKRWEYFYDLPETQQAKNRKNPASAFSDDRNHYIALNVSDLLRTDLTIFYEFILPGNKIGLRIPVTYGFRSAYLNPLQSIGNPFPFRRNTVFKTGVDLRIYAGRGMRKARFVFGPAIYYVRLNKLAPDYLTVEQNYMVYKPGNSMRILFLLGVIVRPTDYLQFGFDGGLGGDIDFGEGANLSTYPTGAPTIPKAQLNVHIGYRF